jgi:hypothetical protein
VVVHRIAWARPMKNTPGGVFRHSQGAPTLTSPSSNRKEAESSKVIEGRVLSASQRPGETVIAGNAPDQIRPGVLLK